MENRIEKLRQFLRKYWLPVLEKKEKIKNNIKLSIELQLAITHATWMVVFGMLIFIPVGYIIWNSELHDINLSFFYGGQHWNIHLPEFFETAIVLYMAGILFVLELSKKNIQRISSKMGEIVKSSKRITINNLEKERLNVDGIQNELKEVATTINEMLDRLQLAYETQKQFASDASHELRTPIAVIQGYINMLDRWGANDKEVLAESVEAIKNEAASMKELVEKLLFLSRNDKKTLKLTKKKFDMGKMVEEIVKESTLIGKNRYVEDLGIESMLFYGDRQMLKEAMRVFVENAIKYTNDGDHIYIGCEKQNGKCVLIIADTGIGMKEKDLENIFQRFYRADQARNSTIGGHGLGLSIAKLIIQKHVGTIQVKSQYTKGTCFRIELPIQTF